MHVQSHFTFMFITIPFPPIANSSTVRWNENKHKQALRFNMRKVKIKHTYWHSGRYWLTAGTVFSHDPTHTFVYELCTCWRKKVHYYYCEICLKAERRASEQREREKCKNQSAENAAWLLSLVQLKKCNHALNDFNSLIVCAVRTDTNNQ